MATTIDADIVQLPDDGLPIVDCERLDSDQIVCTGADDELPVADGGEIFLFSNEHMSVV